MNNSNWIDISSPIGLIRVFETNGKITALEIAASRQAKKSPEITKVLIESKKQIDNYFSGNLKKFTLPIDLSSGTQFQREVWQKIAKTGFGKSTSYLEIARAIGRPKAARAVGGAVGANPVPLLIGCHRVMGSSGQITGYSGGKGIPTKKWLLRHESIPASDF